MEEDRGVFKRGQDGHMARSILSRMCRCATKSLGQREIVSTALNNENCIFKRFKRTHKVMCDRNCDVTYQLEEFTLFKGAFSTDVHAFFPQ